MGSTNDNHEVKGNYLYNSLRSRVVTPTTLLKVNDSTRERQIKSTPTPHAPAKSFEICRGDQNDDDVEGCNYGLQILGCNAPGIADRPISARSRLGAIVEDDNDESASYRRAVTDANGDIMEMSEDFQKLKIARNQIVANRGEGDIPSQFSQYDMLGATAAGITIHSLTSNTVVVVPETHRNNSARGQLSSAEESMPVHPSSLCKTWLSNRRKPNKNSGKGSTSSHSFHSATTTVARREQSGRINGFRLPSGGRQHDDREISDEGGNDVDYFSPPHTGQSTAFEDLELMRPDTASSAILGECSLAEKDDQDLQGLAQALGLKPEENWYSGSPDEDDEESSLRQLRLLTKMFYRRDQRFTDQGLMYSYKLMMAGLHNRLEDYVLLTAPPGFLLKTRITRVRKGLDRRFYPLYYMHLEREGAGNRKCLILVAKKQKCFGKTSYVITTDPSEFSMKSEYCVGLVNSNFLGTEFTLYSGRSLCSHIPPEQGALQVLPQDDRFKEELAMIAYVPPEKHADPNVLGFKGPRKIKMVIPKLKNLFEREEVHPRISEETLSSRYRSGDRDSILCLKNKEPTWSKETTSYILNFAGRVSTASVKNFQVVHPQDEDNIMLQFGRASENMFSLDFRFPFCPLQAFAIALSSFESKLACE